MRRTSARQACRAPSLTVRSLDARDSHSTGARRIAATAAAAKGRLSKPGASAGVRASITQKRRTAAGVAAAGKRCVVPRPLAPPVRMPARLRNAIVHVRAYAGSDNERAAMAQRTQTASELRAGNYYPLGESRLPPPVSHRSDDLVFAPVGRHPRGLPPQTPRCASRSACF